MTNHPNRSTKLSIRSKIVVRWTTNPADMGYDGRPSNWMQEAGETMSVRRADEFAYELGQRVGHSTYKRISYQHREREISADEIRTIVLVNDAAQS